MRATITKAKVTSKGQLTLPRHVRERLGVEPGDVLQFEEDKQGRFVLRKSLEDSPFKKWRGFLKDLEGRDPDEVVAEMRGP